MGDGKAELATKAIEVVGKDLCDGVVLPIVQPAAQASGHALGTLMNVFNLLLAPLERAQIRSQDKTDRLRRKLAEGADDIPPEQLVEVPLEVSGTVLEIMKYVTNESLEDMFVQLLLSAMNSDTQAAVHPSFAMIINELSPYDAWMLKQFYETKNEIAIRNPIINMKKDGSGTYLVISHIPFYSLSLADHDKIKIGRSIDNLIRLKLINLVRVRKVYLKKFVLGDEAVSDEQLRRFIEHIQHNLEWSGDSIDDFLEQIDSRHIILTSFGLDFCESCIK